MVEDIMIGMNADRPHDRAREEFLHAFSETTRYMLGGRLTFTASEPFTNRLPGKDDEILPAGFLVTAQKKGVLRSQPMDSRELYACMAEGLKQLHIVPSPLGLQRTSKGVWMGFETVDRLHKAHDDYDRHDHVRHHALLAREVFANGFLKPQGKHVAQR